MVERKIKKFFSRRLNPYKNVRVEAGLYKPRFAASGKKRKKKRRGHAAPTILQLKLNYEPKYNASKIGVYKAIRFINTNYTVFSCFQQVYRSDCLIFIGVYGRFLSE